MPPPSRASGPRDIGAKLFTFAVVADTHVNQEEGKASSDFAVNRLSNARNRNVIHEINRIAPAFVLHLGDIVHPTPIHPGYAAAAASYQALAAELRCPIHLTPGNHDVGDKPGDWLPVPSVNDDFLALYRKHFGDNYYSFDASGCHFVIIDAQLINSGLGGEALQRRWLEEDLAANAGKRVFLCTHYPPYLYAARERSHYDNIDEPGRAWLLGLFERHKVEAVFAGHVHNFWYHLHGDTQIYLLPSTAFVRLDYSELFRIEPAAERGRNDAPKLGFFQVDVHEHGHVAHTIRTFGAVLAPGEKLEAGRTRLPPVHTRTIARAPFGIDLRYPWAETVEVAASGALDEFSRKSARNDYPLMSLWEMGIRRLRVPIGDLADAATRARMNDLRRMGHEFTVYTLGVPTGEARDWLLSSGDLVGAWEVIAARRAMDAVTEQVIALKAALPLQVYLSKLHRHDDAHHHGERARHVIQHGFIPGDYAEIEALRRSARGALAYDGFVFRVACEMPAIDSIQDISRRMRALGTRGCAYVRLAAESPSVAMEDDLANANRVAEAVIGAFTQPGATVWLDTFGDVDRGYFPRSGLVDRRYNPRIAGHVCQSLQSAFNTSGGFELASSGSIPGATVLTLVSASATWLAVLPRRALMIDALPLPPLADAQTAVEWINLARHETRSIEGTIERAAGKDSLRFGDPLSIDGPALFCLPLRAP